jgi:hypothetical protein
MLLPPLNAEGFGVKGYDMVDFGFLLLVTFKLLLIVSWAFVAPKKKEDGVADINAIEAVTAVPQSLASGKVKQQATGKQAENEGAVDAEDEFDEDLAAQIQDETIPKSLRFNSPGRKANLSIFVEGKRQRKSTSRFIAQN